MEPKCKGEWEKKYGKDGKENNKIYITKKKWKNK